LFSVRTALQDFWNFIRPSNRSSNGEIKNSIWFNLKIFSIKTAVAFVAAIKKAFAHSKFATIKTGHGLKFTIKILSKILHGIWIAVKWIVHHIADMFRKIPSELTYWHDGELFTVHVDDFVELAPNLIQYRDSDTKKRVKVKAEYPIKYILKEK
jgi:hypothetical protein